MLTNELCSAVVYFICRDKNALIRSNIRIIVDYVLAYGPVVDQSKTKDCERFQHRQFNLVIISTEDQKKSSIS